MSTSGVEDGSAAIGCQIEPSEAQTTLENLPPELRSKIIYSIGDLRTLKSLIRSSPTYHEQYRLDRDKILRNCLGTELNGFYVDAFATVKSCVRNLGRKRTGEVITTFLGSYRQWLTVPRESLAAASSAMLISCSDIRWLSSYHLSVILPLTGFFCHWAHTNLARAATSSENAIRDEPAAIRKMDLSLISNSERTRIMRALYRYEIYHHLFGYNEGERWGSFMDSEIADIFFTIFQPWEAEEIGCIDLFIEREYTHVFNEVKADLHPKSPRFDHLWNGRGLEPEGSHEVDIFWLGELISNYRALFGDSKYPVHSITDVIMILCVTVDYMQGTMARGLETTARILDVVNNHDQLVDKMARCLNQFHSIDAKMSTALYLSAYIERREDPDYIPTAQDAAEGVNLLPFQGDTAPPTGPPLAWVIVWKGKYVVSIYGGYIPVPLKEYGWVMWDECRLDSMGVRKLIAGQWNAAPKVVEMIKNHCPWLSYIGEDTDKSA